MRSCDNGCGTVGDFKLFETRENHILASARYYCHTCDVIWKDMYSINKKTSLPQRIITGGKAILTINGKVVSTAEDVTFTIDEKIECDHEWNNYVGLSESFDYCQKCDVKRK